MRIKFSVLFISVILMLSCSQLPRRYGKPLTHEESAEQTRKLYIKVAAKIQEGKIRFEGGDGSTIEEAIVIKGAGNTGEGIAAENIWIMERHGGGGTEWNKISQSLNMSEDRRRQFDVIEIEIIPSGEKANYYFDITSFFGKW